MRHCLLSYVSSALKLQQASPHALRLPKRLLSNCASASKASTGKLFISSSSSNIIVLYPAASGKVLARNCSSRLYQTAVAGAVCYQSVMLLTWQHSVFCHHAQSFSDPFAKPLAAQPRIQSPPCNYSPHTQINKFQINKSFIDYWTYSPRSQKDFLVRCIWV